MSGFDPYYQWLGIPPKDQPPDHYRLLGVERFEDNSQVIENAADRQMSHLRTFHAGEHADEAQHLLNQVAAARVNLLNVEKKSAYDEQLQSKLARRNSADAPQPVAATARPQATAPVLPTAKPLANASGTAVATGHQYPNPTQPLREPLPQVATEPSSEPALTASPVWRQPWAMAAIGGAAVLFSIVMIAIFAGGTSSPEGGSDGKIAAIPAKGPEPGKKKTPRISNLRVSAKSPDRKTQAKQSDNHPGKTRKTPSLPGVPNPPVAPAQRANGSLMALRFAGKHRVVLDDTAGMADLARPFTAEAWMRFTPGQKTYRLLGDFTAPAGQPWKGWFARLEKPRDQWMVSWSIANGRGAQGQSAKVPPPGDEWHHLAFTAIPEGGPGEFRWRVHYDGKKVFDAKRNLPDFRVGTSDFFLGPVDSPRSDVTLFADVRAFRFSTAALYDEEFTPQQSFSKEPNTEVLLDFSSDQGQRIADQSGNVHHGRIDGATWLALRPDATPEITPAPTEAPAKTKRHPYALRFAGQHRVELADSPEIGLLKPLTAEMWVRFRTDQHYHRLIGNSIETAGRPGEGWYANLKGSSRSSHVSWQIFYPGGFGAQGHAQGGPGIEDGWHHLVIASTPLGGRNFRFRFYWDGKKYGEHVRSCQRNGSGAFYLGSSETQRADGLHADVRAFRLSLSERYVGNFTPPATFEKDPATFALLDFSAGKGETLPDLSGQRHHGKIHGAEWITIEATER